MGVERSVHWTVMRAAKVLEKLAQLWDVNETVLNSLLTHHYWEGVGKAEAGSAAPRACMGPEKSSEAVHCSQQGATGVQWVLHPRVPPLKENLHCLQCQGKVYSCIWLLKCFSWS